MNKKLTTWISSIFIIVFSAVLALGTWNPFVPPTDITDSESGIGLAQIVSVLFIIYLFIRKKEKTISLKRWSKILYTFYISFFLLTLIFNIDIITVSAIIVFMKLLLVILLCLLLPKLFIEKKYYINLSIYVYSIVSVIIALLFLVGALEEYITFSDDRFCLFGENPNSTSARFSLAFILLLHIILKNPFNWSLIRYLQLLFLFPILNVIMASGSRGSFIILVISVIIYLYLFPYKKSSDRIWVFSLFLTVLIVCGIYILSINSDYVIVERLIDSYTSRDDAGRDLLNGYAIDIWLDSPLIGEGVVGFDNEMKIRFRETRTVHNLYIYILSTSGIIGFSCFMNFLYKLFKDSLAVRKNEPISFVILFFMILMAYKTGGILTYILMWYVFSIVITYKLIKIHEK